MISPWIWSQSWKIDLQEFQSEQNITDELFEALDLRSYAEGNISFVRLALEALEEALVKRIKERSISDVPTESEIEILFRASKTELQVLIDGEVVFTGSIENRSE